MQDKIKKYINSPIFVDSNETDFSVILRTLLVTLLILSPIVLVTGLLTSNAEFVWGVIVTTGVVFGALWLLRQGFIKVAGLLLPLVLILLAMYFVFVGQGLNDTAFLLFPLAIILAGFFLGRLGLILFTLIAILYTFFILYATINDLIITCCNHLIRLDDAIAIVVILTATTVIFDMLSSRLSTMLVQTRHKEQALRESEAKLRLIYENAYDGISIYEELPNRSRRLIDCNDRYAEIAGRSKEELLKIGSTSQIQKKVSPEMNMEEVLRIRRENTPYHGLFSWNRPDGKENIIEYSAAPIQVGDRHWTIGLDRDITEHKQITEKLRENEAHLTAIINQMPFDLWACDADGRYIIQNAISLDIAGSLIGKTVDDLDVPPHLRSLYKKKHLQALSGQTVREEIEVMIKGQPRILESVQAPIFDKAPFSEGVPAEKNGRILGFIGLQFDITERKAAAQKLQEYSEQLEEMVAERTRALENAQERLIRQEKLAFLGQLAGSIGHELRNPLGIISNAIYFLKMALSDADVTIQDYLDLIGKRVAEADKIVSDLLNLSRNRSADLAPVQAKQLITDVLARHPVPETVTLSTNLADDLPALFVDAQQIQQVLSNLVINAYQAMPEGGALTLSAQLASQTAEAPTPAIVLAVRDTGAGMSSETLSKVFEPLYTTKTKGVGLGLAVSKNLVEINGGIIDVQSIPGQGATFIVTLPVNSS